MPTLVDDRVAGVDNPLGLPAALRPVAETAALVVFGARRRVPGGGHRVGRRAVAARHPAGAPAGRLVRARPARRAHRGGAPGLRASLAAPVFALAVAALPVAVGVAVLQHRLYEVDVLVNRTLLYALLTSAVAARLRAGGRRSGRDARTRAAPAGCRGLATAVVAVAFQPLREAIQGTVNRLTYGAWDDPQDLLRSLHTRLEQAVSPDAALPDVARRRRGVPAAGLPLRGHGRGRRAGLGGARADGRRPPAAARARRDDGRGAGARRRPVAAPRRAGAGRARRRTRTGGAGGPAARGPAALPRAAGGRPRGGAPPAAPRPARRPRAGAGRPHASSSTPARNRLGDDPLLREMRGDVQATIADVRRLVDGLRPVAARRARPDRGAAPAGGRRSAGGPAVRLVTDGAESPAAAVEVAAYRIVQEALTNVLRHSGAAAASVGVRGRTARSWSASPTTAAGAGGVAGRRRGPGDDAGARRGAGRLAGAEPAHRRRHPGPRRPARGTRRDRRPGRRRPPAVPRRRAEPAGLGARHGGRGHGGRRRGRRPRGDAGAARTSS